MVVNASQTMESDMVNYLKRERDLCVKLKGVVVFRIHLGLYINLLCTVLVFVVFESRGLKGPEVLPKGLEYPLLTTELVGKTLHDTGSGKQRLCLRNMFSHVS